MAASNLPLSSEVERPRTAFDFYRPESIDALRNRMGRPAHLVSLTTWALVAFIALIVAGAILFLATGSFARKETVDGWLQPTSGATKITYHRAGFVTAVHAEEGATVRKGQPLFSVSFDPFIGAGETLGTRLRAANLAQSEALEAQQRTSEETARAATSELQSRLAALHQQQASLLATQQLQRDQAALASETIRGLEQLKERGFVSPIRLRDKQAELLALRQQLEFSQRQTADIGAQAAAARAELTRTELQAADARARFQASEASLAERRAQMASEAGVILTAPQDGRLATVRVKPGTAISPQAVLAMVMPRQAELQAELWAPSRAAGFVQKGDRVRIMYDAFPFQRFGAAKGVITDVSRTPVDLADLPLASESKESLYRIKVKLDRQVVEAYGRRWALAPGGRLKADIVLERQSFIRWILDPVFAARARAVQ